MLLNTTRLLAEKRLDEILAKYPEACKCDKCRQDILAHALNSLPPYYAVSDSGQKFAKAKSLVLQYDLDIIKEITKAIELVAANPRHE